MVLLDSQDKMEMQDEMVDVEVQVPMVMLVTEENQERMVERDQPD